MRGNVHIVRDERKAPDMSTRTLIGASVPKGVAALRDFTALKLGACVLTLLPMDKAEALAVASYCREHKIRLFFSELLYRGDTDKGLCFAARRRMPRSEFYTKAELEEIIDAAGDCYGGRMTIGESGGILYWPKSYSINRRAKVFANLPAVRTMAEAKAEYLKYLRKFIDYERRELGKGPLLNVDSALVFKYHAEAGIDVLCLESMPGDPHLMHAAIRGAAKAYRKPWGTHNAIACYGGVNFDELWLKRWKTSLYQAYINGAGFIWPESGHYIYDQRRGQKFDFTSPEMRRVRRILREAYQFSRIHTRPEEGPKVTLGVVYGNLDGAPGLWNRYVWGQFKGKKWLEGPAERGWKLVNKLHRKEDWPKETVQGDMDFSGNPPYGQYDVVPIEAPLSVLESYRCLVFLSWNTMTSAIYSKLKQYVQAGGHLVMYLPHLSTETDRAKAPRLYRNGDFRDLFGVQIMGKGKTDVMGVKCMAKSSLPEYRFPFWRINTDPRFLGEITPARLKVTTARVLFGYDEFYSTTPEELASRPFLVENSLGKGKAFLVTAWQYPADEGLLPFTEDLLRTVIAGEQGDLRLVAGDRVRYAVFEGMLPGAPTGMSVVYLLNTDPDCASLAKLWINGRMTSQFEIPANDLRMAYLCGTLAVIPEDRRFDLKSWRRLRGRFEIETFSAASQKVEIHNLGAAPVSLILNHARLTVYPGSKKSCRVPKAIDPLRKEFFAADFLDEPPVQGACAEMPY